MKPAGQERKSSSRPRPQVAAALSAALPGLGQLYTGRRSEGVAMLCLAIGIWFWMAMATIGPPHFRSWFTAAVLALTYVLVWTPAVTGAYRSASTRAPTPAAVERRAYVIFMVLATGAMAVPLLWQSPRFSRNAKYAWSVIGIANTMLALLFLAVLGPAIDRWYRALLAGQAIGRGLR